MKGVYCKMFPAKHLRLLVCPRDMVAAGGADQYGPLCGAPGLEAERAG